MIIKRLFIALMCYSSIGYTQTIDGGNGHSIMLCGDNLTWSVGSNTGGQLGDGTTINQVIPIETSVLTDVVSVQAGAAHSIALKPDGTVWSWGNNNQGQLGNNSTTLNSIPIQITVLSDIVKIVAGNSFNIALKNDSTTLMWGANYAGQINGAGSDKLFPIPAGGLNTIDIGAGDGHTIILKGDGGVWAQGANDYGQLGYGSIGLGSSTLKQVGGIVTPLMNIIAISAGASHSLALKTDSTILSWGRNTYGQLGDNTTTSTVTPIQVTGLTNIISIVGGQRHSIALKGDGTVWTWGWNGMGQLGNNTLIDELTPIQVPGLDSVIEISAGAHHCMARRSDSTIWVWGNNGSGQLGNDTALNTTVPVQMMLSCQYQCTTQVYSGGDISICSGDSAMIFGTYQQIANTYTDSFSTPNGCDSIIQIELTVDSLPVVSFSGLDSTYCTTGLTGLLTGSPAGGVFSGTGVSGTSFDPLVAGAGTFTVMYLYTDLNGCSGSESKSVTVSACTGINETVSSDFRIYPNPTSGIINIQSNSSLQIINPLGQVIYSQQAGISQADLSEHGQGIYFVRSGSVIKKLVLTK